MALATRPSGRGLPITTSSSVALGAELGHRLEQGDQSLHRHVRRRGHHDAAGHRAHLLAGAEHRVVDPHGDDGHPAGVHPHLGGDVGLGRLGHRDHPGEGAGHLHLHPEEAEPAPLGEVLPGVGGVGEGQLPVDGDRVVERLEERPAVVHHPEDPVAQALVVVDQVEVVPAAGQELAGPEAEGPGLGEAGGAHHAELEGVDAGVELAELRDPEGVRLAVEVEAGDRREADALVHLRPGLAGEHLHRVAQRGQLTGQVAGVDPLPPAAGVAPVDQEGDPEAVGPRGPGRDPLGHRRGRGGPLDLVPSEPETRHRIPLPMSA